VERVLLRLGVVTDRDLVLARRCARTLRKTRAAENGEGHEQRDRDGRPKGQPELRTYEFAHEGVSSVRITSSDAARRENLRSAPRICMSPVENLPPHHRQKALAA
jgi:hypothetical protein